METQAVEKAFSEVLELKDTMLKCTGDDYYLMQNKLNEALNQLARKNFLLLDKHELIEFLALCSRHRPMAPHSLLTRLSIQHEETTS
jgi:hypothetical protein